MNVYRLVPKPCRHEAKGRPHKSTQELVDCLDRFGVPGFTSVLENEFADFNGGPR